MVLTPIEYKLTQKAVKKYKKVLKVEVGIKKFLENIKKLFLKW